MKKLVMLLAVVTVFTVACGNPGHVSETTVCDSCAVDSVEVVDSISVENIDTVSIDTISE
jgi:hypothetical protein